jgi:hypothetical protein
MKEELVNSVGHATNDISKAVAKKNNGRFYVRKDSSGMFYNPDGIFTTEVDSFNKRYGKDVYEFRGVTESAYNMYIKFLLTKNPLYLRKAEREIQ